MSGNPSFNQGLNIKRGAGQQAVTTAIVLRARPYRDSDLIVHFLTPGLGKIAVLARHARNSKKRFPNSLDLFDRGTARMATEKSGAWGLAEFSGARSFTKIRSDLDKLTLASLICESFDLVLQEDDESVGPELFEVLDLALNAIEESGDVKTSLRSTFIALSTLCQSAGIADLSNSPPGSRSLSILLNTIERHCERPLMARNLLGGLFKKAATTQG